MSVYSSEKSELGFVGAVFILFLTFSYLYHIGWSINTAFFQEREPTNREMMIAMVGGILFPVGIAHGAYEIFVE